MQGISPGRKRTRPAKYMDMEPFDVEKDSSVVNGGVKKSTNNRSQPHAEGNGNGNGNGSSNGDVGRKRKRNGKRGIGKRGKEGSEQLDVSRLNGKFEVEDEEEEELCVGGGEGEGEGEGEVVTEAGHGFEQEYMEEEEDEGVVRCMCNNRNDYEMMIQCEECHVWQHTFCVGIRDEKNIPELYYCEECRAEDHPYINQRPRGVALAREAELWSTKVATGVRKAAMAATAALSAIGSSNTSFGIRPRSRNGSVTGSKDNNSTNKETKMQLIKKGGRKKRKKVSNEFADDIKENMVSSTRNRRRGVNSMSGLGTCPATSTSMNKQNDGLKKEGGEKQNGVVVKDKEITDEEVDIDDKGKKGSFTENKLKEEKGEEEEERKKVRVEETEKSKSSKQGKNKMMMVDILPPAIKSSSISNRQGSSSIKIRFPPARSSLNDMYKRSKQLIEYLETKQSELEMELAILEQSNYFDPDVCICGNNTGNARVSKQKKKSTLSLTQTEKPVSTAEDSSANIVSLVSTSTSSTVSTSSSTLAMATANGFSISPATSVPSTPIQTKSLNFLYEKSQSVCISNNIASAKNLSLIVPATITAPNSPQHFSSSSSHSNTIINGRSSRKTFSPPPHIPSTSTTDATVVSLPLDCSSQPRLNAYRNLLLEDQESSASAPSSSKSLVFNTQHPTSSSKSTATSFLFSSAKSHCSSASVSASTSASSAHSSTRPNSINCLYCHLNQARALFAQLDQLSTELVEFQKMCL
ncbi:putative histone deacetylase complex subunit cti6 [Zancudomyces culisetae]|uniref:Putative histone deacetylase complex subunit cti6 n=1 Tax=Zancudomyces culisetae TaxID=1213189 RepID=A0A1R1PTV9_ZANCU|nr:putative histone deacetylase complex subunit cti6 [Zancudomyces culisetae]|eukprot:OMH84398.1 putative histone deacetylase complex subunit cti6 [Zancudomyces culisetae]